MSERFSPDTSIQSEARILDSVGHSDRLNSSSSRDDGGNVIQVQSALGILSNSEILSLEDLEWILMIHDDLSVENIDGAVRQQVLGYLVLQGDGRPEHDLLALPNQNEF